MAHIPDNWQAYLLSPGIIVGAVVAGLLAHRIAFSLLAKPSLKLSVIDASLVRHSRRPSNLILPLLPVIVAERVLPVSFTVRISAWDLRCYVREKLIDFLQREYPNCLPRLPAEFHALPEQPRELSSMRDRQALSEAPQHAPVE